MGGQDLKGVLREFLRRSAPAFRPLGQDMLREERDVLTAVPQGREVQHQDIDAVVQVFSEGLPFHQLVEMLVRGRDDPHVDFDGLCSPHAREFPFLQHPQQFGLRGRAEIADFVEKQRAAVGQFELTDTTGLGVREGSLFVPE